MPSTGFRTRRDAGRESVRLCRFGLPAIAAFSLAACLSDAQLLQNNENAARHFVEHHALSDIGCNQVRIEMLAKSEEPGQPLGELASAYRLQASGCGKTRTYAVLCEDQTLCSLKSPPRAEATRRPP